MKERTVQWHKNNPKALKQIQANAKAKPGYKEKQAKVFKKWYEEKKKVKCCPTCQREID
ncbi:MAG: hypothetical protein V3V81_08250 [Candidatus Bathyarchaeia archaeon]